MSRSPHVRATYILREAFEYSYDRIADILQVSEDNARQLCSRARKHIQEGCRNAVSPAEQRRLPDAFTAAARGGDLSGLEQLLASDVTSYSDGGGVVRAAQKPIAGQERVANFIAAISSHFWSAEPSA